MDMQNLAPEPCWFSRDWKVHLYFRHVFWVQTKHHRVHILVALPTPVSKLGNAYKSPSCFTVNRYVFSFVRDGIRSWTVVGRYTSTIGLTMAVSSGELQLWYNTRRHTTEMTIYVLKDGELHSVEPSKGGCWIRTNIYRHHTHSPRTCRASQSLDDDDDDAVRFCEWDVSM